MSVTIPDSVTWIGPDAFAGCTSLKSITIPESVTEIKNSVFERCISLESITLPKSITEIHAYAFNECSALSTIYVPAMKADYYKKRLPEKLHDKIVELAPEKKTKTEKEC